MIPEKDIIQYLHTLVCGLEYLHDRRIPHMAIKPENILLSSQGKVKLSDVSGVRVIETEHSFHTSTEAVGTQAYIAPELLQEHQGLKRRQLFMADIWSLGAVIGELMLLKRVSNDQEEGEIGKELAQIEGKYSKGILDLVIDMVQGDATKRKTASEIKKILEADYGDLVGSSERIVQEVEEEFKEEDKGKYYLPSETSEEFSPKSPGFLKEDAKTESQDLENTSPMSTGFFTSQLAAMKRDMKRKWQDILVFEPNEVFGVRAFDKKKVEDGSLREFMAEVKKQIPKAGLDMLESCNFNLSGSRLLTDNGIRDLTIDIGTNMANLKQLTMNLELCIQVTDQGIRDLSTYIGTNLINLQHLDLNFTSCSKITSGGLKDFAVNTAYNLDILEHLALNFRDCGKVTDQGVKELATHFGNNLASLKHLEFNFSFCSELSDQALIDLSLIGPGNQSLEALFLKFTSCHRITDKGITHLGNHIAAKLKNLTKLSLDFDSCSNITDNGLKGFATPIGMSCRNLLELHLNFTFCSSVTDNGVKKFIVLLGESLRNLDEFSLNFTSCNNISDSTVKELPTLIGGNLINARMVDLNFTGCYKVTTEAKNQLKAAFSFIPKINIV